MIWIFKICVTNEAATRGFITPPKIVFGGLTKEHSLPYPVNVEICASFLPTSVSLMIISGFVTDFRFVIWREFSSFALPSLQLRSQYNIPADWMKSDREYYLHRRCSRDPKAFNIHQCLTYVFQWFSPSPSSSESEIHISTYSDIWSDSE